MSGAFVKICGVQTQAMARFAAGQGATFLGIIMHPSSIRFVEPDQAARIAEVANLMGVTPVAVFVDQSADEMLALCQRTNIRVVQLHGAKAKKDHRRLPDDFCRIYVKHVDEHGMHAEDEGLRYCQPYRDYLLFDHSQSGRGRQFSWDGLATDPSFLMLRTHFRIGIAGGLSHGNVQQAIKTFQPYFVDVASGVERQRGIQDKVLVQHFIQQSHSIDAGEHNEDSC